MRNTNSTYSLEILKHIIVFSLLIILTIKPIVNTVLTLESVNYEWLDSLDKETSKEKKGVLDFEDENIQYYFKSKVVFYPETSKMQSYFKYKNELQNYSLDILLPPPELL